MKQNSSFTCISLNTTILLTITSLLRLSFWRYDYIITSGVCCVWSAKHLFLWLLQYHWSCQRKSTFQFIHREKMKAVINNGLPASMDCHMGQNLIITEIHKSMMEIQNWPYLCISIIKFLVSIIFYGSPQIESQSSIHITALLCIK